ncbi:hypothetical protein LINGRAHAP2_LOCUS14363 [Linum grandiflorum]
MLRIMWPTLVIIVILVCIFVIR